MHFNLVLCLLIAALCVGTCSAAAAAAAASPAYQPWHLSWWRQGRRLHQQQQQRARAPMMQPVPAGTSSSSTTTKSSQGARGVPACMWNDVNESCSPSQLVFLSLSSAPSTVVHRAATTAYDRNLVCNGHPDPTTCQQDRSNRCFFWNKSCVGMDAYELVNWFGAGSTVNGDAALLDFTCPGSVAAQYKLCRTATDAGAKGICNSLPGCQFVPLMKECVPKEFDSKPLSELQSLIKAYNAVDSSIWGGCEGACYVKQANLCQQSYNSSASCKAKPYCVWEFDGFDGRNVCLHRDTAGRGTDAFSQEYAAIKDLCVKMKSQGTCEEPKVMPKQVGTFRAAARGRSSGSDPAIVSEAAVKCVT